MNLEIGSLLKLTEDQPEAKSLDYVKRDFLADLTVRRNMRKYARKQWRWDTDTAARGLLSQQIVLFKLDVVHE